MNKLEEELHSFPVANSGRRDWPRALGHEVMARQDRRNHKFGNRTGGRTHYAVDRQY